MAGKTKKSKMFGVLCAVLCTPVTGSAAPDSVVEIYRQWSLQCQIPQSGGEHTPDRICELSHHLTDNNGQRVLSLAFTPERGAEAGLDLSGIRTTILTPAGVNLRVEPTLVLLQSDQLPFVWDASYSTCVDGGCVADFLLASADVETLKASSGLQVTFGMMNVEQSVELNLPTDGLAEALGALADAAGQ